MTTFPEYESFDALGLANLIQRRVVSPLEVLEAAIERAEVRNPQINAIIYPMYDIARANAVKRMSTGIFAGVPFLLKDLLADYAGVPTSSGSHFTQHWLPEHDGEVVTRIKAAGLNVFGKTNVPEFGLSSVTESSLWGAARNPWDLTRTPGGSSGGSAAAVAAGIVPMAHGNDGGGSIRIPAAYCGLFGLKPSRGRTVIGSDILRMWETMVVEHTLTRSVRDSAAMLDVLSQNEATSSFTKLKAGGSFLNALNKPVKKLQLGLTDQPFFAATVSPDYVASLNKAGQLCQDLGHNVELVSLHINGDEVARAFIIVTAGEIAASIKRFATAIKRKPTHKDLERQTALLSHIGEHVSAADFAWARNILDSASRQMAQYFNDYDVLMTPTMAGAPPLIGELKPPLFEQGLQEILTHVPFAPVLYKALDHAATRNFAFYPFTPIFNISGQPAMSVPLYWDANGLPIGIQFAGRFGEEATLLQLAHQLEQACPWQAKKPLLNLTEKN